MSTGVRNDERITAAIMTTPAADSTTADSKPPAKTDNKNTTTSNSKGAKKSTEYALKSGLAGGFAGCAAKTVVGPLDRVKILFQTRNPQFAKYAGSWAGFSMAMADIYRSAGVIGLFKGHSATLLRIFPYAGIKFLAYEQVRARLITTPAHETPARRFLSGSLAGVLSVTLTYPLEVIRVRLAFETHAASPSSLATIIRHIYAEQPRASAAPRPAAAPPALQHAMAPVIGLANFFRGFTPTLLGMVPYAGASFLVHDTMSDVMRWARLAPYTTLPHTARDESPTTRHKPAQLRSWAELATGGIAGFVSQTVSYPLEVIRRRMQVGAVVGDGRRLAMDEVMKRIYRERGYKGFFVGLTIGYVKVVPMVAVSFYAYERGKYYLGI